MLSTHSHPSLKKSPFRYRKRKSRQQHRKKIPLTIKRPSLITGLPQFLIDLQQPGARFISYTITELEPICQQIAIQQMSSSTTLITSCPWICLFCEDLIYEPLTLYCGHTYCEQCIKDEELSSSIHCPRCPKDIQGQIQSSIIYAREHHSSKNHFLKEIIERSEVLKYKCENILSCHKAHHEYMNKNYQQAVDIYSKIIEKYPDDHTALYGRARTNIALKHFDTALADIEEVVRLKPQWAKGYYCRSEIFFEMKRFTTALLSSLQGLTLDPENQTGKQIMARHLHAVINNNDEKESTLSMGSELNELPSSNDNAKTTITSGPCDSQLLMCRSTPSASCLCALFDNQHVASARNYECSICISLLWYPVTTPCGHVFCQECLIRSIDNTQTQCPMCKSSLEEFFPILIQSHVNKTEIVSQIIESYLPNEFHERRQMYEQENVQGAPIPKALTNDTEPLIFEIPVFVCVLALPDCTCPLHVFEPRYRLMMRRTVESQSRTFGMCAYDEQTETFADYGTLLYIRGLVFTQDGRSIVDTIGQRRFRVIDRGTRDEYDTARVQLIRDHAIDQEEFDALYQLNRDIYKRVRDWFEQLDAYRRTLISRQLEGYPPCDDLVHDSADGSSWTWIMLNLLPIEPHLQYTALTSQSFRTRLQMINNTIDFLFTQQQQPTTTSTTHE